MMLSEIAQALTQAVEEKREVVIHYWEGSIDDAGLLQKYGRVTMFANATVWFVEDGDTVQKVIPLVNVKWVKLERFILNHLP